MPPNALFSSRARLRVALCCVALSALPACSLFTPRNVPVQYFVLTASPSGAGGASSSLRSGLAVGLGPVTLPGYLDRREIVTRVAPNELRLAQNEQWGEPLAENVRAVLAQDLSARLGGAAVATFPWLGSFRPDYRVRVDLTRFEPTDAGTVELVARWQVLAGDDVVAARDAWITRPISGGGTAAAVTALGEALGDLATEIASAIPTTPRRGGRGR
ncbi:MAG TPA: PqiC family protein [Candidatus Binatia bacterium]